MFDAKLRLALAMSGLLFLCAPCAAADWPQWRGPARNGIAADSPALLDEFPKDGPRKVWASEPIPTGSRGGWGSCAVADGKVYVYSNRKFESPKRILTAAALDAAGYAPDMPPTLSKAVEEARASAARAEIKDTKVLDPWVNQWVRDNVKGDDRKFAAAAQARLRAGPDAIPLDILDQLKPILDQTFETQAKLDEWLKAAKIVGKVANRVSRIMVPRDWVAEDLVYCLDAQTGKTIWRTPLGADFASLECSATPTIADGKCYVWNSQGRVYCLDAKEGKELWKSDAPGDPKCHLNRSSSVLLTGGLAVVADEVGLEAFGTAQDGKLAWSLTKFRSARGSMSKWTQVRSPESSAMTWTRDGTTYILVNACCQLLCVDPSNGQVKWISASGSSGHGPSAAPPSTDGDFAALCAGEPGVIGYTLSADGAKQAWKQPFADTHAGVIIKDGYVYAIGCAYEARGKGRAVCIEQKTGNIMWDQSLPEAQLASPVLADGKIIAVSGPELVVFKAAPEKFSLIGKADLGLEQWCSPAIADGKLFLRAHAGIVCYDLKK